MKRYLIINKCEDCNRTDCGLKVPVGLIPDACPLPKSGGTTENTKDTEQKELDSGLRRNDGPEVDGCSGLE